MPLGVVSDDEFELEINGGVKDNNPTPPVIIIPEIIETPSPGRNEGDNNVAEEVRKFIAEAYVNGSTGKELSLALGVSRSSVSAYANGANSTATYNDKKPALVNTINFAKGRIAKRARKVLNGALDELTPAKLATVKAKDLASIAKNMSGIVKDMEPDVINTGDDNRVQIVMFAPPVKKENYYDAIDVSTLDGD